MTKPRRTFDRCQKHGKPNHRRTSSRNENSEPKKLVMNVESSLRVFNKLYFSEVNDIKKAVDSTSADRNKEKVKNKYNRLLKSY